VRFGAKPLGGTVCFAPNPLGRIVEPRAKEAPMSDEHQHTDEPTDEEREETISDLEPSEDDAEDVKGGRSDAVEGFKI